jgi:Putative MetA-pathway of phenol degradation
MKKQPTLILGTFGMLGSMVLAGTVVVDTAVPTPVASADGFAQARRPISNPTLFDLALPATNVHPIFLYHRLPDSINTRLGSVPLGGDAQLYALQFEIAINDRLSIVATKDGYADMNFDNTLNDQSGFANLGAGLKYAFILDPVSRTAVSGTATFELPTGNSDVFQGEGDGAVNLIVNGLKLVDDWQFAGSAGVQLPFSDEQSISSFVSAHVSYEVCPWFIPLVELNWFHVLDAGNGTGNFPSHLGGALPAVLDFEGGDLFNLGAANSHRNSDLVTLAMGFRSRVTESVDVGFAYELPLTDEEDSLMEDRFTVDLIWNF